MCIRGTRSRRSPYASGETSQVLGLQILIHYRFHVYNADTILIHMMVIYTQPHLHFSTSMEVTQTQKTTELANMAWPF